MKRIIILSLLCCICFCGCQRYITNNGNRNTLKGNGNIISQNRTVTPFHAIRLDAPVAVQVIQGNEFSVVIKGDENLCPLIKTAVRQKKLVFYTDEDNLEIDNLEAVVTMPQALTGVKVSGMGYLNVSQKIETDLFEIETSGMGKITLKEVDIKNMTLDISGMGKINATGKATNVTINNSGMGKIDLEELIAKTVRCNNSGMGKICFHVTESLHGNVSGMGKITYYGNPPHVNTEVSGMGSISKK